MSNATNNVSNSTLPPLPGVHRIVVGQDPTGTPLVIDDTIVTRAVPGNFWVAQTFVQDEFIMDPRKAFDGANGHAAGMGKDGGVVVRAVDFPPNTNTAMHFTDTLDHVVIAAGKLELVLTDGSKRTCVSGDYIVQLGGFHQWNNVTDEWARFICVCLPSKPVLVDGQPLDKGPLKDLGVKLG